MTDVVEEDVIDSILDAYEGENPLAETEEEPVTFDFDEDFQQRVLAHMLRDKIFLKRCAHLVKPDYFESLPNKLIAKIVGEHFEKYHASLKDPATLKQALAQAVRDKRIKDNEKADVVSRIKELFKVSIENPDFTADMVTTFARNQAIENAMFECVELHEKGNFDKMQDVMEKAFRVGQKSGSEAYDYFNEIGNRSDYREQVAKGLIKKRGLPLGVPQFDNLLHHKGFGYKELTVFMAAAKRGKCVTRDTLVYTEDGLMAIGDYVDDSVGVDQFKPLSVNILGRDGLEKTSHVYNSGLTDTLKLTTSKGLTIEGTYHHPMLTLENGKHVWKNLEDVKIGDALVAQPNRKIFGSEVDISYASEFANKSDYYNSRMRKVSLPTTMTPELAEFMGMMTAEAYCSPKKGSISFYQKDEAILQRYCDLVNLLFDFEPTWFAPENKTPAIKIANVTLYRFLNNLGVSFCHSSEKEVPLSIRKAPENCVRAFLSAVIGLEGNVRRESDNRATYDLCMASPELIRQVQVMLMNYGILAKRSVKQSMATNGARIVRDYHRLQIRNTDELCVLRDDVGLYEGRKQRVLEGLEPQLATKRCFVPHTKTMVKKLVKAMKEFGFVMTQDVGEQEWKLIRQVLNGSRASQRSLTFNHLRILKSALDKRPEFKCEYADQLEEILACDYQYELVTGIEASQAETVDFTVPKTHSFFANGLMSHNTTAIWDIGKRWSLMGKNVLGITLEVSQQILADRLDANISGVPMNQLEKQIKDVKTKLQLAEMRAGKFIIHEYGTNSLRPMDVEALIEDYRSQGVVFDAVVVDYLDIMAPNKWMPDAIANSKSVWEDMRAIAQNFDVVMLSATQLNRDGAKKTTADDTDVAEDYNKIRIADLVMSINATDEELAKGESRIYFAASRNQRGKFSVLIKNNMECMQFLTSVIEIT